MRCMKYCHRLLASVLGIMLLTLCSGHAVHAQTRAYVYDQIAVTLDVQSDGLIEVTEELSLAYTGGPFTFARRDIALQRLDAVRDVQVREGNRDYVASQSEEVPGTFLLNQTSTHVNITWYYEPTQDTTRTFTLSYTVEGAVRTGDNTDTIWWTAVFPDREVPVQQNRVTINLPVGADLDARDVSLPAASGDIQIEDTTVQVLRTTPLPPGQSLDVRIALAPELIDAPMPGWQQSDEATLLTSSQQQASGGATGPGIGFFIGMIALLIVAIPLILFLIFRYEPPHRQESDSEEAPTSYPARRTSSSQGRSSYYGGSSFSDSGGSSFSDSGSSFGGGGDGGSGGGGGGAG